VDTKVKLTVRGITNSQAHSGAYALVLSDDGPRHLPVIVGLPEAQSIAIALEELDPPRPLTHDLFVRFAQMLQIRLREVFIYKFEEGVFYSELIFWDGVREIRIDSRTSDAIAIALRTKSDIYTLESIIQKCAIILEENMEDESSIAEELYRTADDAGENLKQQLSRSSVSDLQERMAEAIRDEDYEFAEFCKEELLRREQEEPYE
jgi:bifunctional DNase/RNase